MKQSIHLFLATTALLSGCASAGGTAGVFDTGSVWYKHPTTADVKECGGGFYPGVQIRRRSCGNRYLEAGYVEVEKCKVAQPGALCVTDAEIQKAEGSEKGVAPARAWVLWRTTLDSAGHPIPEQWTPIRGFDSRQECEAEQRRAPTVSLLCLPETVDPRGPKGN